MKAAIDILHEAINILHELKLDEGRAPCGDQHLRLTRGGDPFRQPQYLTHRSAITQTCVPSP
jgi:hypothetical protein